MNYLKYFSIYILVSLIPAGILYYNSLGGRGWFLTLVVSATLLIISAVLALIVARVHRKSVKAAIIISIAFPVVVIGSFAGFIVSQTVIPACSQQALKEFSQTRDANIYDRWCVSDRSDYYFIQKAEEWYDEALFDALLGKGVHHRKVDCARLKFAVIKADLASIQALLARGIKPSCNSSWGTPLHVLQSNKARHELDEDVRVQIFNHLLPDSSTIAQNIAAINDTTFYPAMKKTGVDVNISDVNDAIYRKRHDLLAKLARFVDLNSGDLSLPYDFSDQQITSPLMLAVNLLDEKSVQILLEAGADPNHRVSIQAHPEVVDHYSVRDIYTYTLNKAKKAEEKAGKSNASEYDRNKYHQLASRYNVIVSMMNKSYQPHPLLLAELNAEQEAQKKVELTRKQVEKKNRLLAIKQPIIDQYGRYPEPAKPVFFYRNSFMDSREHASPSRLNCRMDLLRFYSSELEQLRLKFQQPGGTNEQFIPDKTEFYDFLFGYAGCQQFDPRLSYYGLLIDGGDTVWEKIDLRPTLKISYVQHACGGDLFPVVEIDPGTFNHNLIVGVPENSVIKRPMYKELKPASSQKRNGSDIQLINYPESNLGAIESVSVEKHYTGWFSDEPPLVEQTVIDRATLYVVVNNKGKVQRIKVFEDKGSGKYGYLNADVNGIKLFDADLDGDVDLLFTDSGGGQYLIKFQGNKPAKQPIILRYPQTPMFVGGC